MPAEAPADGHVSQGGPVLHPGQTMGTITDKVAGLVHGPTSRGWLAGFAVSLLLVGLLTVAVGYLFVAGVGIWGVNVPAGWGFAIANLIWWVGIAHAGTLISAGLLLLHQPWRKGVHRLAEATTLFALACSLLFPLLHLGRPGFFYWMIPYPSTSGVWPQFRSPLEWDMIALQGYAVVSVLFWYVGLLPDLATLRDQARGRVAGRVYGVLALGWRGDAGDWHRYQVAYRLLAGLAVALLLAVVMIASYDFAASILPGWHVTSFPPYFVAGALFSGFAVMLVAGIPIRAAYRLHGLITDRHLHNLGKLLLAMSLLVAYGYAGLFFMNWYSGDKFDWFQSILRVLGPYAPLYWVMIGCNVLVPQVLWSRRLRSHPVALWAVGLVAIVGTWLDRYILVLSAQTRDFLPSAWGPYSPTVWDWALFIGSIGLFLALGFVYLRVIPIMPIYEMRELVPEMEGHVPPEGEPA